MFILCMTFKKKTFKYLTKKRCLNNKINLKKTSKKHTFKNCKKNKKLFFEKPKLSIEWSAKLNIPLFPTSKKKQVVLGNTKNMLPYFNLPNKFITLYMDPKKWNWKLNQLLIDCFALNYFNAGNVIRLITNPSNFKNDDGELRITAKEICILKHKYNLNIYKYINKEFDNIYFIALKQPKKCKKLLIENNKLYFMHKKKKIYI